MTIGHNASPPLDELTDATFRAWVKMILSRDDLTSTQKLLAVAIGHEANPSWEINYSNDQIKRLLSVSQRETIYEATRKLVEKGVIAQSRVPGMVSTYRILPPHVVESIAAVYEAQKAKKQAATLLENPADPSPPPLRKIQQGTLSENPAGSGEGCRKIQQGRVLDKPADGVLDKPTPTLSENPATSEKPAGFIQQGSPSRAYSNNNYISHLEEPPENKPPYIPPTPSDPKHGIEFTDGELRLINGTASKFAQDFPGVDLKKICDRVAGRVVELKATTPNQILALIRTEARKETDNPKSKTLLPMPSKTAWDGEKLRAIAEKQGLSIADGRLEFEAFKAHHLAKGSRFKDWYAAWRTWCLNHAKRGYGRKAPEPKTATATGMNYDWVLKTYGQRDEGGL